MKFACPDHRRGSEPRPSSTRRDRQEDQAHPSKKLPQTLRAPATRPNATSCIEPAARVRSLRSTAPAPVARLIQEAPRSDARGEKFDWRKGFKFSTYARGGFAKRSPCIANTVARSSPGARRRHIGRVKGQSRLELKFGRPRPSRTLRRVRDAETS